jgi:hypothetical protein
MNAKENYDLPWGGAALEIASLSALYAMIQGHLWRI